MVSLKSFLHYFSEAKPATPLSDAEVLKIERLAAAFGGEANIEQVDACLTRLRVTVKELTRVDSQALQDEGALASLFSANRYMLFLASNLTHCVNYSMSVSQLVSNKKGIPEWVSQINNNERSGNINLQGSEINNDFTNRVG